MGKRFGLLVALMVLLVVSGGILYYVNNKAAADIGPNSANSETAVTVPANGLAVKVVGSDGATILAGAKVGVIAIDTDNAAALAKFAVPAVDLDKLTSNLAGSVEKNTNITQNVLTETGLSALTGMAAATDTTFGPNVVKFSANDLTYNFPVGSANVASNGIKYYNQDLFTVTDSATSTVKTLIPIRVYVDYNGTQVVKDLVSANPGEASLGALASDYTYDSTKTLAKNTVTVTVPAMPPVVVIPPIAALNEGASGLTFRVLNLDNKPLAGAKIRGQLLGYAAKNTYPLVNFEKTSDADGMVTLSVTDIENLLKTDANNQAIDFTKPIYVSYECSLNNSYSAPDNSILIVRARINGNSTTIDKILSWVDVFGLSADAFRLNGGHKAAYRYALRLDNLRTVVGTTTTERAYGEVIHLSAMAQ